MDTLAYHLQIVVIMKFKELPSSIARVWQLVRKPINSLGEDASEINERLIVSLTSIESRLSIVHLTIRSLLDQSVKSEKIVLWLHHSLSNKIPNKLSALQSKRFEIHFSDQTCAHRKLVESLKLFPDHIIVTCDDDVMYPNDWLLTLHQESKSFPLEIVAHECRVITYDENNRVLPYANWSGEKIGGSEFNTLAIGYGGVLYPPHSLHKDVTKRELYDNLAPRADDLWFKAMAIKAGTSVRRTSCKQEKPVPIAFSQGISLKKFNVREDGNRMQWQATLDYYTLPHSA
jgi:hypothetical protein